MPSVKKKTRPRLAAPLRRDHLLDVAGRLVRQGGWGALSMQGLAVAAGVSRQLVYGHFSSADELYLATLTRLFERAYNATEAILHSAQSPQTTISAAYELFLDLPAEERRALRALATDVDASRPELARAKKRLRSRIASLWVPYVRQQTSLPEAEAQGLAWMLTAAAWGLADTIADGTLDRKGALRLFVNVVQNALEALQVSGNSRTTTAAHRFARSS